MNTFINKIGSHSFIRISSDEDFEVVLCSLGASIYSIRLDNDLLTLTNRNPMDFFSIEHYHGKTIGRVANRIKGRDIKIDGNEYHLENNDGENTLHGGLHPISQHNFDFQIIKSLEKTEVIFSTISKDGESGFPGNLELKVIYTIGNDKTITINYLYSSDKKTPVSLTNHVYFNLGEESIENLRLNIKAHKYARVGDDSLLFEEKKDVDNIMDFTKIKKIGMFINSTILQNTRTKGYDHFYYFDNVKKNIAQASLSSNKYLMSIYTDYEGLHIYTDNYPDGLEYIGPKNEKYKGIAMEIGDSHEKLVIIEPNKTYSHFIKYVFDKRSQNMTKNRYKKEFKKAPEYKVSSGGRVEMIGNHTDHNHGLCCAFTCNLEITGYVGKRHDNKVACVSKGFKAFTIDLNNLSMQEEASPSAGLIRGIARYFKNAGYKIGGFNLVSESSIFPGAGVSSSAAFESLIGQIFNVLFNKGQIDRLVIAKAGQYAENNDFGKKSGLLDQIGTGYGNISYIDFEDIANPKIERLTYPFKDLHFVIVNTGGNHSKLNHLYSSIPEDMWNAAKKMGHEFLRECKKEDINKVDLTEMEKNRAIHFFSENERVVEFKKAIETQNEKLFLKLINESRTSSTDYLKNMMIENMYEGSPLQACDMAMEILGKDGACRINGGGFAGSIICVVPTTKLDLFIEKMSDKYGKDNVCQVSVNTNGPLVERL